MSINAASNVHSNLTRPGAILHGTQASDDTSNAVIRASVQSEGIAEVDEGHLSGVEVSAASLGAMSLVDRMVTDHPLAPVIVVTASFERNIETFHPSGDLGNESLTSGHELWMDNQATTSTLTAASTTEIEERPPSPLAYPGARFAPFISDVDVDPATSSLPAGPVISVHALEAGTHEEREGARESKLASEVLKRVNVLSVALLTVVAGGLFSGTVEDLATLGTTSMFFLLAAVLSGAPCTCFPDTRPCILYQVAASSLAFTVGLVLFQLSILWILSLSLAMKIIAYACAFIIAGFAGLSLAYPFLVRRYLDGP